MAKALYADALERILVNEGGYVNHPNDPGGPTNKGVTQRVYDAYRDRKKQKRRSVKSITIAELQEIYRKQYADIVSFDELPAGVDYAVFDGAVNSGPKQAAKWLQRALRPVYKGKIDGDIGNLTLDAARKVNDHDQLIADMLSLRLAFLQSLKTWATFAKGWKARLRDVKQGAQAWARGSVPSPNEYREGGDAPAPVEDMPEPAAPTGGPTVGAGAGGAAAVLETARQQIEPIAGYGAPDFINQALGFIVIALAVIAIGGFIYGLYAKWKADKLRRVVDGATPGAIEDDDYDVEVT